MNKFYERYEQVAKVHNDWKWIEKNVSKEKAKLYEEAYKPVLDQYKDYKNLAGIISSLRKAVKAAGAATHRF